MDAEWRFPKSDLVALQFEGAEQFGIALHEPRRHFTGAGIALNEVRVFMKYGDFDRVEVQTAIDGDDVCIAPLVKDARQTRAAGAITLKIVAIEDVNDRRHIRQAVLGAQNLADGFLDACSWRATSRVLESRMVL
jgi:hypothetical protein